MTINSWPLTNQNQESSSFIIPNKIQNTKGGKITNTRDFGQILVVCLVELHVVSPVDHSANSVGVRGYSSG